ncbi:MAG: hypothetical protein QOK48_3681 [Blastocatellia bacterium]|nr:hypothetical protein [Blastocatellia bacterium]
MSFSSTHHTHALHHHANHIGSVPAIVMRKLKAIRE